MATIKQETCPVCTEKLTELPNVVTTGCGHHFCANCLFEWMGRGPQAQQGCPICRAKPLTPETLHQPREVVDLTKDEDKYTIARELYSVGKEKTATVFGRFKQELARARERLVAERPGGRHAGLPQEVVDAAAQIVQRMPPQMRQAFLVLTTQVGLQRVLQLSATGQLEGIMREVGILA